MGISKVEYCGNTLIDLSADTVTPETLLEGATAHNAAGEEIVGVATLGDDSLLNSIIDRSIAELNGDWTSIGSYCFCECTKLRSISLPNVTTVGSYVFQSCYNLQSCFLPNLETGGQNMFSSCVNLQSCSLPSLSGNITQFFRGCSKLESVDIPLVKKIGGNSFTNCVSLTQIKMPSVEILDGNPFVNCSALRMVDAHVLVSIDGVYCFEDCSVLSALIIRSDSVCTLSNINSFTGTPIESGTGYIYVPSSLVDSYKSATNWSTFADQIRAIEDYPEITGGTT